MELIKMRLYRIANWAIKTLANSYEDSCQKRYTKMAVEMTYIYSKAKYNRTYTNILHDRERRNRNKVDIFQNKRLY